MAVKRTVKGFTMLTYAVNLPRERVVGKDVEYKYKVVTPAGKYWEELSVMGERGQMNRLLRGKLVLFYERFLKYSSSCV